MDPFEFQSPQHHWHQYPYYQQQPFHQPMPQSRGLNQLFHKLMGKGHNPYGRLPQVPFMSGPGMAPKYAQLYETLNHVQKGLGIIQQVSPYIKQYGPFVKNLPMLVDMVKIMMENEGEEHEESHHHEIDSDSGSGHDTHEESESRDHKHHEELEQPRSRRFARSRRRESVSQQKMADKSDGEYKHQVDQQRAKTEKTSRSKRGEIPRPKLYI